MTVLNLPSVVNFVKLSQTEEVDAHERFRDEAASDSESDSSLGRTGRCSCVSGSWASISWCDRSQGRVGELRVRGTVMVTCEVGEEGK